MGCFHLKKRRRFLIGSLSFPDNFLFREGYGFNEKIASYIGGENGASGYANEDFVYIHGGNETRGFLVLSNSIKWVNPGMGADYECLHSESINTLDFTKIKVEMTCYSNAWRTQGISVVNESKLNKYSPDGILKKNLSEKAYGSNNDYSATAEFYDTKQERKIYELDIANFEKATFVIRSGDMQSMYAKIHNIWLE
jgi:hypothetical protein